MSSRPQPKCWLRNEVFEYGLLPYPASSKLTFSNLIQVSRELQTQAAKSNIPSTEVTLSLLQWKQIAKEKFNLSPAAATVYFDAFDVVSGLSNQDFLTRTREELAVHQQQQSLQDSRSVNLQQFLLLLFVQSYNKPSLRSPRQRHTSDVWPGQDTSSPKSMLSPPQSHALQTKGFEESNQRTFIKQHLYEILQLVSCKPDDSNEPSYRSSRTAKMERAHVDVLSFLVRGGYDTHHECDRLSSLAPFWGGPEDNGTVSESAIEDWFSTHLVPNTYLYPPTPKIHGATGAPLSPRSQTTGGTQHEHTVTPEVEGGLTFTDLRKPIAIAGAVKRTVVITESEASGANLRILCCNNSYLYILAPVRHVTLFGCNNCTVVIGAASNVISVEHCERTSVIATGRHVRVANCSNCSFYICSNLPPHLIGENHGLVFGPFNTYYPSLELHMKEAGVNPNLAVNHWDSAVATGGSNAPLPAKDHVAPTPVPYHLVQPESFLPFTVPFLMKGPTTANPCEYPPAYQNAVKDKQDAIKEVREQLEQSTPSDPAVQKELHEFIQARFKDWLVTTGSMRQVQDLLHLEQEPNQAP